jgi:hypothetical protein
MNKIIAFMALAGTLPLHTTALAAAQDEYAKQSDIVMTKVVSVDLLNFLLPLAMTKDQYSKALPVLEKIRRATKRTEEKEAQTLRQFEPKLDAALKDAFDKGLVPSRDLRAQIAIMLKTFNDIRESQVKENEDTMYDALKTIWTATQMKIAAQSLDPKDYVSAAKAEEMTDEEKARLFIREIFLNPAAYDVMLKLDH